MRQANFDWKLSETEPSESFLQMIRELKLSPFVGKLLWQRGYHEEKDINRFLHPKEQELHDPYLIHDMDKAISRIQEAVISGEKILVYGDYDADGITSATVMKETLELLGAEVEVFLPNRFEHGYGPNQSVYQEKIEEGIQLIITVDNGVAGNDAVAYAQQAGVDVIITDHHELPENLPDAYAIVHPRHPAGHYPFPDLAGVGVAFKVASALLEEPPAEFLDLVAIGTIADLVSLTDENRILVSLGIDAIHHSERIGLQALFEESGVKMRDADETTIGFSIAPRLNAIGRMGDPRPAVSLLATFDEEEASVQAKKLNEINEERKAIVEQITQEALAMVNKENHIHLLVNRGWHEGVLGIVAGKIMNETGKPTLVLTLKEDGSAKGSGRSIEALNLFEMLDQMRDLFTYFGGHHAAVGLTMPSENVTILQEKMNQYIVDHQIDLMRGPELRIDEVLLPNEVTVERIDELKLLAPFGTDNPLPQFLFRQLMVSDFSVGGLQVFDWRAKRFREQSRTSEGSLYLAFDSSTLKFVPEIIQEAAIVFEGLDSVKAIIEKRKPNSLVVMDCPDDLADLKEVFRSYSFNRVYLMGISPDEAYLNGVGTREQYAKLFKLIHSQERIDIRHKIKAIAQYLRIPEKLLIFMIQVFFELKFVTIENGVLQKVASPESHPLTESRLYQRRLNKIKVEEFLLLSDIPTIKKWLTT